VVSVVDDLLRERRALASTLELVGPSAPTTCGTWTAEDIAVHVVTGEVLAALPNAPFRWMVGKGVRLDRMASVNERALVSWRRRRSFEWAIDRLKRPPPLLHRRGLVADVTLLEHWVHHEDVLGANDVGSCEAGVDLAVVLRVLVRYQRRLLERHHVRVTSGSLAWREASTEPAVVVDGPTDHLARWLAGREGLGQLSVAGASSAVAALAAEQPRV
jgi:uncharacterized protein (TIGR03083 family)